MEIDIDLRDAVGRALFDVTDEQRLAADLDGRLGQVQVPGFRAAGFGPPPGSPPAGLRPAYSRATFSISARSSSGKRPGGLPAGELLRERDVADVAEITRADHGARQLGIDHLENLEDRVGARHAAAGHSSRGPRPPSPQSGAAARRDRRRGPGRAAGGPSRAAGPARRAGPRGKSGGSSFRADAGRWCSRWRGAGGPSSGAPRR